jgi:hypothetical protein
MSLQSSPASAAVVIPPIVPLAELLSTPAATGVAWLWEGYLAAGKVTLLTSLWKMGKTTLLSVLLAKMKAGGELAGRPVSAARPLIVTEETPDYWVERGRRLDLAPDVGFLCQPFRAKPTPAEWHALMDHIDLFIHRTGVNLVVIDPLATFLPGRDENSAAGMMEALLPLQTLTKRGVAVLLLHHPRKKESDLGHSARGSGALTGHADILLELRPYPKAGEGDRRRRLFGMSRFVETPRHVVLELNDAGTDYACLGELSEEAFTANWEVLFTVLTAANDKLTRREILEHWPIVEVRPDESTLWRWLERAVADGRLLRDGTGRSNSPFKYWLKEAQQRWKRSPYYMPELELMEVLEPDAKLPPLLPPSIQKLLAKEKKRRG